jgi:hypothetical protein
MFKNFCNEDRAVCEIMWKNMVLARQAAYDSIKRRMRFACRDNYGKNTDTHSQYIILLALLLQQLLRDPASLLPYTSITSPVFLSRTSY